MTQRELDAENSMDDSLIEAADAIIKYIKVLGGLLPKDLEAEYHIDLKREEISRAAESLRENNLIRIKYGVQRYMDKYELTTFGIEFKASTITYGDFFKKKDKQTKGVQWDEQKMARQIVSLKKRLHVLIERQSSLWKAQEKRNKRITLMVMISSFFSLIAILLLLIRR